MVATPIGAARDITLRALDILSVADVLACEDTRTTRKLLDIHGIALGRRQLVAYHDHSPEQVRDRLVEAIRSGQAVACVSEAGTPMVSDPGFGLARAAAEQGLPVVAAPGASAVLAALCVAGLPSDRFLFAGFPPAKSNARKAWLAETLAPGCTTILYESPKRIMATLADLMDIAGPDRQAALCRELTKKFEETLRGTLNEISEILAQRETLKGEIVLVIGPRTAAGDDVDAESLLRTALSEMRTKEAVAMVAEATGLPKRDLYTLALEIRGED